MRTMDKLGEEARGSFIWTLLSGRALEVVEHLKEEDYQKKGGEQVIFDLLDRRAGTVRKSSVHCFGQSNDFAETKCFLHSH